MPIKRVWVADDSPCTICHLCETLVPDVFEVGETTSFVKPGREAGPFGPEQERKLREARRGCPAEIISLEEAVEEAAPQKPCAE